MVKSWNGSTLDYFYPFQPFCTISTFQILSLEKKLDVPHYLAVYKILFCSDDEV